MSGWCRYDIFFLIHVMYKVRNDMGPYMHVMWVASFHYCSDGFSSGLITSSALLIKLHMANGTLLDNCVVMIRYCISVCSVLYLIM